MLTAARTRWSLRLLWRDGDECTDTATTVSSCNWVTWPDSGRVDDDLQWWPRQCNSHNRSSIRSGLLQYCCIASSLQGCQMTEHGTAIFNHYSAWSDQLLNLPLAAITHRHLAPSNAASATKFKLHSPTAETVSPNAVLDVTRINADLYR